MANSTANSAASSATPSTPPSGTPPAADRPDAPARRARTRIIAGSWRLPLVVLVGVLLAGALVTLYGGLNRHPAAEAPRAATGVVIATEPCAQAGARDTVRIQIDGRTERLPVNACGNPAGFQLDLELLTAEDGTLTARLAGTGGRPGSDLAARISAVLLVLAGLAGAALVMQLVPGSAAAPTPVPTPAGRSPGTDGWSAPLYPTPTEVGSATVGSTPVVWPAEEPPADRTRARPAVAWPTEEPTTSRPPTWPAEEPAETTDPYLARRWPGLR